MLIQLADDTTLVTDGGSYGFNVEVEYASDGSKKTFPTETILATHDKTVVNFVNTLFQQQFCLWALLQACLRISFLWIWFFFQTSVNNRTTNSFYLENIGTNDSDVNIAKGESKRFVLEMVFPEGESQDVIVKFMTSLIGAHENSMTVCGTGLTFVGENFPCLDKTNINPVYTQRLLL